MSNGLCEQTFHAVSPQKVLRQLKFTSVILQHTLLSGATMLFGRLLFHTS